MAASEKKIVSLGDASTWALAASMHKTRELASLRAAKFGGVDGVGGGGEGSHRQAAGVPAGARRSAGCSIGAKRLSWPSQSVARCSVDLF